MWVRGTGRYSPPHWKSSDVDGGAHGRWGQGLLQDRADAKPLWDLALLL